MNGSVDQEMRENVVEYFKVFKLALFDEFVNKGEIELNWCVAFRQISAKKLFFLVSSVYDHQGIPLKLAISNEIKNIQIWLLLYEK